MNQPFSFRLMLFLALLQGVFGLLRAYGWVQIGADLFRQGLLLLPFVGAVAVLRGLFISVVALLYVLFVVGALQGKTWARWVCLTAIVINLLLVLNSLIHGANFIRAVIWAVVPVILLFYLFSQTGRDALKSQAAG